MYTKKDETFLARWVANDLSKEELEDFQNSEEYHTFQKINEASQALKAPEFNNTSVFSNIEENTFKKKKEVKVVKLIPNWAYGAVASIALLFSFFYFNNNTATTLSSEYGKLLTVTLPDNSIAQLSANSSISYNENNWDNQRELSLTGKAYFEVEKGKTFTVNTSEGKVTVLGTKFTVNATNNFFEVQCYEGKVKVTSKNTNTAILTKGKAFRIYNNTNEEWTFNKATPSWLNGESEFNNTPLSQVIIALEKQYNLKIDTNNINLNKRFTGTFTHKDVNIALKTVFAPMKISYTLAKNSSVILKQ